MNFPSKRPQGPRTLSLSDESAQRGHILWRMDVRKTGRMGGGVQSTSIGPVPDRKFKSTIDKVQTRIEQLSLTLAPSNRQPEAAVRREVLALRVDGASMTATLFGAGAKDLEAQLRAGVDRIEFREPHEGYSFPIEFCYFGDPEGDGFFLGDRCLVIRVLDTTPEMVHADAYLDVVSEVLPEFDGSRAIGYAEGSDLNSSCLKHASPSRPDVEEVYALGNVVSLSDIDYLDELKIGSDRVTKFRPWLATRKDVVHFNAHAQGKETDGEPTFRAIRVRDSIWLLPEHFAFFDHAVFEGDNLVFLNVCGGLYGALDIEDSIPATLMSLQAGAVACSVGVVEDGVGVRFATEVYKGLADGASVFNAMLNAKRTLNAELGHPLANLYTLVGDTEWSLRAA